MFTKLLQLINKIIEFTLEPFLFFLPYHDMYITSEELDFINKFKPKI